MAVSLDKRRQRVANGSRRKRDLQAVGASTSRPGRPKERWQREADAADRRAAAAAQQRAEREARLRPHIERTEAAEAAWGDALARLREVLPDPTYALWIDPIRCVGEIDRAVCLEAPAEIRGWVERRYGPLIGEAVRAATEYRGAFIFFATPSQEPDKEEGLL